MTKVSIIVPTYNRSNYLRETIKSILSQSYDDFEVIVTDNDSTDDTASVVTEFKDRRIIYYKNETNVGSVNNYNVALSLAKGEYIHFFSDDDVMLENCLAEKIEILDKYPSVGMVHSDINIIGGDGNIISESHYSFKVYKKFRQLHSESRQFINVDYHKYLWVDNLVCMPAAMVRRDVFDKIGYLDKALSFIVDWQYWLKLTLYYDVYYVSEKLMSYRIHSSNTVKQLSIKIMQAETEHIKNDLKRNHSNHLIIKSNLQLFLLKFYYKAAYPHYYNYPIKRIIDYLKNK